MELHVIAKNGAHEEITLDEIVWDHLILEVRDENMQEHILRANDLTLSKEINMCKATEQTSHQLKTTAVETEETAGGVKTESKNDHIPLEPPKRAEKAATHANIQELIRVIKKGWLDKKKCPLAVQPYYDERSELIELQGLVFLGD